MELREPEGTILKPFDNTGHFQSPEDNLSRLAVRSAGKSIFAQAGVFVIQVVATVVLARILSPADFGLVAMVTTFSLLLANFGLNGFTEAVLQRDEISEALASNLFWITVAGGLLLTLAFVGGAHLLARFYGDPRVFPIALGLSPTILISTLSVIHLALLRRALSYTAVSANDVIGRFVGVVITVIVGLAGWGYWALVVGAVAQPLSVTVGAWIACQWMPGLPTRRCGTRQVVRYSTSVYGRFGINYFSRNMDNLLVGRFFGAHALGFYKKAYDLFVLPSSQLLSPVVGVVITTLSRFNRDREEYKRHFLRALSFVALVGMALGADLTLVGRDLVRLLLGPGWETSGQIFTFFAPGVGLMMLYMTLGWIHLSIGTADRWLRWTVLEVAVTGLLFVLALHWGAVGIAAAWTLSFAVLIFPGFWYAGQPIGLHFRSVLGVVWKYVIASLCAGVLAWRLVELLPPSDAGVSISSAALRVVVATAIFSILYILAIAALFRGIAPLTQLMKFLPEFVPFFNSSSRSNTDEEPITIGSTTGVD